MVKPKNRIQVTGWGERMETILQSVFDRIPEGYRWMYSDDDGNMNKSAVIRYCVERVYRESIDGKAEKGKE